jgi:hypothetical protein
MERRHGRKSKTTIYKVNFKKYYYVEQRHGYALRKRKAKSSN